MSTKDTIKKSVWQELSKIKIGQTISYTELASRIGKSGHKRYISSILKENSFLISVPCHRAIKKNGVYGHYVLGKDFKRYLIEWEKNL